MRSAAILRKKTRRRYNIRDCGGYSKEDTKNAGGILGLSSRLLSLVSHWHKLRKWFPGHGYFQGEIGSTSQDRYHIIDSDGDEKDHLLHEQDELAAIVAQAKGAGKKRKAKSEQHNPARDKKTASQERSSLVANAEGAYQMKKRPRGSGAQSSKKTKVQASPGRAHPTRYSPGTKVNKLLHSCGYFNNDCSFK
jgi:hypothetical protein